MAGNRTLLYCLVCSYAHHFTTNAQSLIMSSAHCNCFSPTRVHKTTNVPVVFMALIHNGFEGCNSLLGASLVPFQGPKKSRFSGPTPSNAPHNDVAPLKTNMYRAIKTTGTLIVNNTGLCLASFKILTTHPLLHPASVSSPRTKGVHSPGGEGGGGPAKGLASYSLISLRLNGTCIRSKIN